MLTAVQSLRLACTEGASTEPRGPGAWSEKAGRRTPCAERAVILPAVQSLRRACTEGARTENAELGLSAPRGLLGGWVGALRAQREL